MTMKKIRTSLEEAEAQEARRAYRRARIEALLGNAICKTCGGIGIGEDGWTCSTCDGMGIVYESN